MNYHNITTADMMNGEGLRVVLWLSGCSHRCKGCQNPQTWNVNSGIPFDDLAREELFEKLSKNYISGITFSGGDPLHENNVNEVLDLIRKIKHKFPNKNIWLYTGYYWEEIFEPTFTEQSKEWIVDYLKHNEIRKRIIALCDVLVDGRYVESVRDITAHWVGSTNQSVIDVQESLKENKIVLYN